MSIRFYCPRCHAALKAPDPLAGILGYCPKCSGTLLFPGERRMSPRAEVGLGVGGRVAQRQGLLDRMRLRGAQPWLISVIVHAAVVALLAILTWQVAEQIEDNGHKVNILLDLGDKEGALRYRGPRDIVPQQRRPEEADLLAELARDRPPAELIEVGLVAGASAPKLVDLEFDKGPKASGFSTQFMGLGARGESFVYIVDKSGSMGVRLTDSTPRRLTAAKAELWASIERLPAAARFHVMFYDLRDFEEMPSDRLVKATRENKDRCRRMMAQMTHGGGTDPTRAFLKAFKMRPDVIFFLTDGDLLTETPRIVERVREMNKTHAWGRTTVHTIAFITQEGEHVLKSIAEENQGSYRFVSSAEAGRLRQRRGGQH